MKNVVVDRITIKFNEFHAANPEVYHELVALARNLIRFGYTSYGIGALFEVLRYNRSIQTVGSTFKLNNDFRALYSRMIMEKEPDLANFFVTRARTSI
jgi:hypothetical protein